MNINRIVRAIRSVCTSDDFETYFRQLQDGSRPSGPTRDESRREYRAMIKSRFRV